MIYNDKRTRAMQALETLDAPGTKTDFRARARQAKFRSAMNTLSEGKLNTATAALLDIYRAHRDTPEGEAAGEALVELAEAHEIAGRHRLAAELFEKLAQE
jgi:TolA-binding protein